MSVARRDWAQIAGLLLLMLAMFMATNCAQVPPTPTRTLPPPQAWPFCAAFCAAHELPFLGVIVVDPEGKKAGCGCGEAVPTPAPPTPAPTPQTHWGPT